MDKRADDKQVEALLSASAGFDHLFANRMEHARLVFQSVDHADSPFHLMGLGVCSFLEAALGMETELLAEATKCLTLSEANAKKYAKAAKDAEASSYSWLSSSKKDATKQPRLPAGMHWEILQADAVVLQGLTHALSESYLGYLQCLYLFNSAHSKFTKLYKTTFPHGIDAYTTPSSTPLSSGVQSRNPSTPSLALSSVSGSISSSSVSVNTTTDFASTLQLPEQRPLAATAPPTPTRGRSFLGRWGGNSSSSPLASNSESPDSELKSVIQPDGPMEELVISGAAFGFGLFNLVFSLLPAKVKTVVGFLGFQSDRRLALQALAVSAARSDLHAVFAGLTLMTYYGAVLLFAGYQANEEHIINQYRAMIDKLSQKYPDGSLWILNRAKILRMTYDTEGAIAILEEGLRADRPEKGHFRQADALLVFEMAWTLLSELRYHEAADAFLRMTELNSWSHATYHYIAAGCLLSTDVEGDASRAQKLLDSVPSMLDRRKIGGRDLPTEVFIKKKIMFYKAKQKRRGGQSDKWVECIKISLAEEFSIFWNSHSRMREAMAVELVRKLCLLSPSVSQPTSGDSNGSAERAQTDSDLDTPDELAIRALLLGILHGRLGDLTQARRFLDEAVQIHGQRGRDAIGEEGARWVGGVALFEGAVVQLREAEVRAGAGGLSLDEWRGVLKGAEGTLERAMGVSGNQVDLSSRLDSRVNMLRGEIGQKREMLGL